MTKILFSWMDIILILFSIITYVEHCFKNSQCCQLKSLAVERYNEKRNFYSYDSDDCLY